MKTKTDGRTGRTIATDGQALGHALRCSIPRLKAAAVAHVCKVLRKHKGRTIPAADELGITSRSLTTWIADSSELAAVRDKFGTWGRVPDRLVKS